jgi:hypothetical protein
MTELTQAGDMGRFAITTNKDSIIPSRHYNATSPCHTVLLDKCIDAQSSWATLPNPLPRRVFESGSANPKPFPKPFFMPF